MVSYLAIGALATGVIALILLILSVMSNRKTTLTDDERKRSNLYQTVAIVLLIISLLLTGTMTFYPEVGQRYQLSAPRVTGRASA